MTRFPTACLPFFLCMAVNAATGVVSNMQEFSTCTSTQVWAQVTGTVISRFRWNERMKADMLILSGDGGHACARINSNDETCVGDRVEVCGFTSFKPQIGLIIDHATTRFLSHGKMPPVTDASVADISKGLFNYRKVRVSGLVLDAFKDEIDPDWSWLLLETDNTVCPISTRSDHLSLKRLESFINATLTIEGLCLPAFHGERLFLGPHIELSGACDIRLLKGPSEDRFDAPVLPRPPNTLRFQRYRADGRVIARWNGNRLFMLTDDGRRLQVQLRENAQMPELDSHVEVIGHPQTDRYHCHLVLAETRKKTGPAPALDTPKTTTVSSIIMGPPGMSRINPIYEGMYIRLRGNIKDRKGQMLILDSEQMPITVNASQALNADNLPAIGSDIEISGICLMQFEDRNPVTGFPRLTGFSLILRDTADIVLISSPPWWTQARLVAVIILLFLLLLVFLCWNATLRIVAERRGRELFRENVARITADLRTNERTRLAIELHDSLAQNLSGIALQIAAGNTSLAAKMLKACREELRDCLRDLRSQALDEKDLSKVIRKTVEHHVGSAKFLVHFNVSRAKVSDQTVHAILRIIRELATNAVRHGGASTIRIAGCLDKGVLRFSVRDDGRGFDPATAPGPADGHFGLQGIRERIRSLDGSIKIESSPGSGTRINVSIGRQS